MRIYRLMDNNADERKIFETMAPSGINTLFARVPQTGKLMLTITGLEKPVSVLNMRSNDREDIGWKELVENMNLLMPGGYEPEECWEMIYAEDFPVRKKVGPVPEEHKEPEKPVTNTLEGHSGEGEKEPENRINTLPDKKKEKKKPKIPEPKTQEKPVTNTLEGHSEQKEIEKAEEHIEYIRKYIREHRWQQALLSIRDLNDVVLKLRERDKIIDIPGQMEMKDLEGGAGDEAEDEE